MRLILTLLAAIGMALSSAALKEHYNLERAPCSINDRWDCGAVNHSPYAAIREVPVAAIGLAGYLVLAILTWTGPVPVLLMGTGAALGFSLELTAIEASVLQVYCTYCVASLGVISLMALLSLIYSWQCYRGARKTPAKAA